MVIALGVVAVLLGIMAWQLRKFMVDMAIVEAELIKELREIKACLIQIHEKQL